MLSHGVARICQQELLLARQLSKGSKYNMWNTLAAYWKVNVMLSSGFLRATMTIEDSFVRFSGQILRSKDWSTKRLDISRPHLCSMFQSPEAAAWAFRCQFTAAEANVPALRKTFLQSRQMKSSRKLWKYCLLERWIVCQNRQIDDEILESIRLAHLPDLSA
jgi:hypothetical protein